MELEGLEDFGGALEGQTLQRNRNVLTLVTIAAVSSAGVATLPIQSFVISFFHTFFTNQTTLYTLYTTTHFSCDVNDTFGYIIFYS